MIALTDQEYTEISSYIKSNYGVNLENKRPLIEGRLSHYISTLGFTTYKDYFDYVISDSSNKELSRMLNRITTNHTFFMREEEHFEFFDKTILPWIDGTLNEKAFRIWSAGCSSGEEPYTLSMILLEYIKSKPGEWETSILASDISIKALLSGQKGIYTEEGIDHISPEWREKYFNNKGKDMYAVIDALRNNVIFRKINLLDDFNFEAPFHTIFCRNVMIYFDNETKTKLIRKFYDALCDGGYFIIGHSESLSTIDNDFQYISPSIYRKAES